MTHKAGVLTLVLCHLFLLLTGSSSLDFEDDAISHPSISSLPTLSLQSSKKSAAGGGGKRKKSTSSDGNNNGLVGNNSKKTKILALSGSSIEKESSEGCGNKMMVESQNVVVASSHLIQSVSKKKKAKKRKPVDIDCENLLLLPSKGRVIGEDGDDKEKEEGLVDVTTRISEASLTNFSSSPFNESSESMVQSALKRLIMLGGGGGGAVKGVKREVEDDDDDDGDGDDGGEVSRSSGSCHSLMMSLDHSSDVDPNGSVIDGGASNFGAPTSLASSSTSNDQRKGSVSSPDSKKKKARTTFTGRQIFELEKQFEIKKYLSSSERTAMAKLLNVTETQVCFTSPFY